MEIGQVGGAISTIGTEVQDLGNHKEVIANGIGSLTEFAEQNARSAHVTTERMEELSDIVSECDKTTERVICVAEELVSYINKVGEKEKKMP